MKTSIIKNNIQIALDEDLPWGDITTENLIDFDCPITATFILKEAGIVAGLEVAQNVFQIIDPNIKFQSLAQEGTWIDSQHYLAKISGSAKSILMGERIALNFLQHLSGIATLTYQYVQEAQLGSASVRVVDTRKTTPGLRYLEKYAVRIGGGHNHRYSLSDSIMLKDNHLALLEQQKISLAQAITNLRTKIPHTTKIEVEITSINEIEPTIAAGADIILLDNMKLLELKKSVQQINQRVITEASGGITHNLIREIAATGVDIISIGAITHSAPALDISLDF